MNKDLQFSIKKDLIISINNFVTSIENRNEWIWFNYKTEHSYAKDINNQSLYFFERDKRIEFEFVSKHEKLSLNKKEKISSREYVTIYTNNSGGDYLLDYSVTKKNFPMIPNLNYEDLFSHKYSIKNTKLLTIHLNNLEKLRSRKNIKFLKRIMNVIKSVEEKVFYTTGLQRTA